MKNKPAHRLPSNVVLGTWWIVIGLDGLVVTLFRFHLALAIPGLCFLGAIQLAYFLILFRIVAPGLGDLGGWEPRAKRQVVQLLVLSNVYLGGAGIALAVLVANNRR